MSSPIIPTRPTSKLPVDPLHRSAPLTEHQKLVKHTRRLVAHTFYGTMLKQMRDSPFKSKLLDGGRGGEAFSSMFDQQLADHMTRGAGGKLVNSIVRHIEHAHSKAAAAGAQQAAPGAAPLATVTKAARRDAYRAQSSLHANQPLKITAIRK
jgi:Rod binding domain-containing protein